MHHRRIHQQQDPGTGEIFNNNSFRSIESKAFPPLGIQSQVSNTVTNRSSHNNYVRPTVFKSRKDYPIPVDLNEIEPFWPKRHKAKLAVLIAGEPANDLNIENFGVSNQQSNDLPMQNDDPIENGRSVNTNLNYDVNSNKAAEEGPYTLPILRTPNTGSRVVKVKHSQMQ